MWYQDQAVIVREPSVIASTLWIGRDAVWPSLDALNCVDKNQLADVLSQFLC